MDEKKVSAGVGVMILDGNKVLLGLRNPDKDKASSDLQGEGTWTFPGGKIDFGDSLEDAGKRELKEETNLIADKLSLLCINNNIAGNFQYWTFGLLVEKFTGQLKTMEPEEIVEWKWFSLDSLPENLYPPTRKMIEMYKKGSLIDLCEK